MKKLIFIPLMLFSINLFSQYVVVKPSQLPAASMLNLSDIFIIGQGTTTKKLPFSVLITELKDTLGGGGISGDFLTTNGIPYPNKASAPVGALYWGDDGLTIDTTIVANATQTAISGNSINNNGIFGSSVNNAGVYGYSDHNLGILGATGDGLNNALFGSTGDSVTFPKAGGIKFYHNGILTFYTDEIGYDGTGPSYSINGNGAFMINDGSGGVNQYAYNGVYRVNGNYNNQIVFQNNVTSLWLYDNLSSSVLNFKPGLITHISNYVGSVRDDTLSYKSDIRTVKYINNDLRVNGDLKYRIAHAKAHTDSIVGYSVGGTQNIFYKINPGTLTIVDTIGLRVTGDSVRIWLYAGTYEITPVIDATTSNANDQLRVKLYRNNAPMSPALEQFVIASNGNGARDTHNIPWYVKGLNVGDWLSFRIQNQTANRSITIRDFGFYIKKVPE